MDVDSTVSFASYDDFCTDVIPLGNGALRRFCTVAGSTWDEKDLVQVHGVNDDNTMTVTDGDSVATVHFDSPKANMVDMGSVVELCGVSIRGGQLHMREANEVLNPQANDLPLIDTSGFEDMRPAAEVAQPVRTQARPSDTPQNKLPQAFIQHMLSRKRDHEAADMPAAGAPAKTAMLSQPTFSNPIRNAELTALDISMITAGRTNFVIGPVVCMQLLPSRQTANGRNSPTKLIFGDGHGDRICYTTFSSLAVVEKEFIDRERVCYYLARGVPDTAWSKDIHPYEVNFDLVDGQQRRPVSEDRLLFIRRGTDEEMRWVLQELRRKGVPAAWDPVTRNDPRNLMSVTELIDAQKGTEMRPSVTVYGVVNTVSEAKTQRGQSYWKLQLIGRRPGETKDEVLYLSLWSSAVKGTGQLIDLFGPNGYDRRESTDGGCTVVEVTALRLEPPKQYPLSTTDETEVRRSNALSAAEREQLSVRSFADNEVVSLATLHTRPTDTPYNVYLALPWISDERPLQTKTGRIVSHRKASFMDDSKDPGGVQYSNGSMMLFADSPLIPAVIAAGTEHEAAFARDAPTGGIIKITDPTRVVIVLAKGVTLQPPLQAGHSNFVSFRGAVLRVVTPADNDRRAEELRQWYIEVGHLFFVPAASLDPEFARMSSEYEQLDASTRSGGARFTAASAAALPNVTDMLISRANASL